MSSSNLVRLTGMSSGLDVDSIVDAMIKYESTKVDKAKQEQQKLEWSQETYRGVIGDINDFKSKYLNYANSSTNMLSVSTYASYDITSSDTYNTYVKAIGSGNATTGSYNIKDITIATKASYKGTNTIHIENTTDKVSSLFSSDADAVVSFKINDTEFSYDFSSTGADKDKTISTLMTEISSKAGVSLKYSQLSEKFTIESSSTGSDQKLITSETSGKFFSTLFGADIVPKDGTDAYATITDPTGASETVIKPTNTFTIDGVSYNLVSDNHTADGITISLTDNVDDVYGKINTFIDDYNKLIDNIYNKITEKTNADYPPLTDDQKKEMDEKQIEKWEEKSKKGLIRNDTTLQNLLDNLRSAFYTSVDAAGITVTEIGVSTSSDYTEHGKIKVDETKLKNALRNNKDAVVSIFTNLSTTQPSYRASASAESQKARKKEEGIFQRISDLLMDNVRTTRDKDGNKGSLLEKAGIVGDLSETDNTISKQITDLKNKIKTMQKGLNTREDYYYKKYSKLESVMSELNSQTNYLSQIAGMNLWSR